MLIDKKNINVIDTESLCLHDLLISSVQFNPIIKSIIINISDSNKDIYKITFINIFEFNFSSIYRNIEDHYNVLFDWELIPYKHKERDSLIKINNNYISNDKSLILIRFLFINLDEINIVCKSINFDYIN